MRPQILNIGLVNQADINWIKQGGISFGRIPIPPSEYPRLEKNETVVLAISALLITTDAGFTLECSGVENPVGFRSLAKGEYGFAVEYHTNIARIDAGLDVWGGTVKLVVEGLKIK